MNRIRKSILIILSLFFLSMSASAQQELRLGLRDTYFARLSWKSSIGYILGGEMSLFNSSETNQIGRIYVGFEKNFSENWDFSSEAAFSMNFDNRYKQTSIKVRSQKDWKWIGVALCCYPNYDTQLKMQWDGEIEALGHILNDLDLCVSFGNIPEYREDIKYFRFGILFKSDNLWVKPLVNLPDNNIEHMRIIVSLGWRLML